MFWFSLKPLAQVLNHFSQQWHEELSVKNTVFSCFLQKWQSPVIFPLILQYFTVNFLLCNAAITFFFKSKIQNYDICRFVRLNYQLLLQHDVNQTLIYVVSTWSTCLVT